MTEGPSPAHLPSINIERREKASPALQIIGVPGGTEGCGPHAARQAQTVTTLPCRPTPQADGPRYGMFGYWAVCRNKGGQQG